MRLSLRLFIFIATALLATDAFAYQLYKTSSCKSGKHWNNDPTFGLDSTSFPNNFFKDAIKHPAGRVGAIGGQSFDIATWKTRTIVSMGNLKNDVWHGPLWGKNKDALMWTARMSFFCSLTEVDIVLNADRDFLFGTPTDHGLDYWRTGKSHDGDHFVRTAVLHEWLHAAGLVHVSNSYAMQNYGHLPWQNSGNSAMAEPLADDARGLRALYGDGTAESDVTVLTTWYDKDFLQNGAATQRSLCQPAVGHEFSDSQFNTYCSKEEDTTACPGDRVYTRFAIVNRRTGGAVELTERLYFSTDSELDDNDAVSPTVWLRTVNKNFREGHSFIVPDLPSGTYWPIIKVSGDFTQETYNDDWIPLRGQITVPLHCGVGGIGGWDGN